MLTALDLRLLLFLNSLIPIKGLMVSLVLALGTNPILRGFPVFASLVVLWFSADCPSRRIRILSGLLATLFATSLSVWLQYHVLMHVRPLLDPAIALQGIQTQSVTEGFGRLSSFPSDTATLYSALAMLVFFESRVAGTIGFLWSLLTVGILRVACGLHYPSDIAAAFLLGPACVYLFTRFRFPGFVIESLIAKLKPPVAILNALLFFLLADAYNLFPGFQGLLHSFRIIAFPINFPINGH